MSYTLEGYLDVPGEADARLLVPLAAFDLAEAYNAGWHGRAVCTSSATDASSGNLMGGLMALGVVPGGSGILRTILRAEDENDGTVLRSWPVVFGSLRPHRLPRVTDLACSVDVMDPVRFLADRQIWGAYRACSIGEMIGGALGMAAGGPGKPTLTPVLPYLPPVAVVPAYRPALRWLHYSLAVGQTLGQWLTEVLGRLGLRMEVIGNHDGTVALRLTDAAAAGAVLPMTVVGVTGADGEPPGTDGAPAAYGPLQIVGLHARPAQPWHSAVVDDPTQPGFRRVGEGAVGRVLSGLGIGLDEAARRAVSPALGSYAEMFVVSALSRQPALRPGRRIVLDHPLRKITDWQIANVYHALNGEAYRNSATLLDASIPWHPQAPLEKADIVVPGVVDGGEEMQFLQPVPRDRLGRIRVAFPFVPAPSGEEADMLEAADTDGDERLTLDDFEDTSRFSDTEALDAEVEAYRAGEYDDPYPDKADDELTEDEAEQRAELAAKREAVLQYLAYRQASALDEQDHDRDGHVTRRDVAMSDNLRTKVADPTERAELESQWASQQDGTLATDYPDLTDEERALVDEYGLLFGPAAQEDGSGDLAAEQARLDAAAAAEKWPPRLPLTIIQPMAGGLHGFIAAHRHGDACRVVVHHPFWAEVVGFQYRDDRPMNQDLVGATAGVVVEHDMGQAWSGLVFRPTEDLEDANGSDTDDDTNDDTDDDTNDDTDDDTNDDGET